MESASFEAVSAGLESSSVNPTAIEVMREVGIDISRQTSKPLSNFQAENFDVVISLCGCGVNLPAAWTSRELFEDWFIDDPDARPIENFRSARDEIKQRVEELLDSQRLDF
jgi:arsenate reductase